MLKFGSLHGRLLSARQIYTDALALTFGAGLHAFDNEQDASRQFELSIADSPTPAVHAVTTERHVSTLTLGGTALRPTIATDAVRAELELDRQPVSIRMTTPHRFRSWSDRAGPATRSSCCITRSVERQYHRGRFGV